MGVAWGMRQSGRPRGGSDPVCGERYGHRPNTISPLRNPGARRVHAAAASPGAERWGAVGLIERGSGVLVRDDTLLDKLLAKTMGLVTQQWLGKHERFACGIKLETLLEGDSGAFIHYDYYLCYQGDDLAKNEYDRRLRRSGGSATKSPAPCRLSAPGAAPRCLRRQLVKGLFNLIREAFLA